MLSTIYYAFLFFKKVCYRGLYSKYIDDIYDCCQKLLKITWDIFLTKIIVHRLYPAHEDQGKSFYTFHFRWYFLQWKYLITHFTVMVVINRVPLFFSPFIIISKTVTHLYHNFPGYQNITKRMVDKNTITEIKSLKPSTVAMQGH